MGAKCLLVIVAILAWSDYIDPHGIKGNPDQHQEFGCDGDECVDTILDHKDNDAVNNERTKRSITCEDAGGICMPAKKQEKCKKSINRKYACSSKKKVCCIEAYTTVTPTTTTSKPTDEVVNQCLKNGTDNSVILQTLNNVDHDINSNLNDMNTSIKSCIHNAKDDIEIKLQSMESMINNMTQLQETTSSKLDELETKIGSLEQTTNSKLDDMETKIQAKLDYIIKLVPTTEVPTVAPTTETSTVAPTEPRTTTPVPTTEVPTVAPTTETSTVAPTEPRTTTPETLAVRCNEVNGFLTPSQDECFVYNSGWRSWDTAVTYCSSQGLTMAAPKDANALWLRKYITETYGNIHRYSWLSGRGDGSAIVMGGEKIAATNPLWYSNPGSSVSTSVCLALLTTIYHKNYRPNQPYKLSDCVATQKTLCELV